MTKYVFKPYNPIWPVLFMRERERIIRQIAVPCDIEHVGSTAIFGLGGKGIIDIGVAANKKDIDKISQWLQMDLGYVFRESGSTSER